jgi:hypothetical protein
MPKSNARIEAARKAYREALEAARERPSAEAWARLLAAGKELSAAEEPPPRARRSRRPAPPPGAEPVREEETEAAATDAREAADGVEGSPLGDGDDAAADAPGGELAEHVEVD